ncbi:citrate synthase [Actinoplanes philippinensis]|uniref:citrate synthase (unknown stereospecificity) n=1 Tax=Actinoplanes philippinensis TaxID=35752 RepID=A0A1I2H182_9ACTN|nr:citrate synthase [Actinoplanes philippinensis]GIE78242.1 citrate synthase [Actinoplanes philippinensis]SFF22747.1 citrate synthase [Actinoplanes philippinensis]
MTAQTLLTTEEVAILLGVKPATVYAYVSRGLLSSRRNADGKNSLFAKTDVDAFLAGRKRTTTPGIQTGITLIKDDNLFFRGRDATVLARTSTYEAVATLLWTGDLDDVPFPVNPDLRRLVMDVTARLPATARLTDRLRVTVAAAAAADPLRFDTTPAAVVATGRQLLAAMVQGLPPLNGIPVQPVPFAEALWLRLTREKPSESGLRLLNAALILLADHDIAASTLAARIAASTRAHPYAVVSAGLAALDGPLHGAASGLAYPLVEEAVNGPGPVATISDRLRSGVAVPGFGHPIYRSGDPRAETLFGLLGEGPVKEAALALDATMRTRSGTPANVDLALAALALHHGMPADAGEAIFAVARTAGWLAHALEEYGDRPSRFRPSGSYAGNQPA